VTHDSPRRPAAEHGEPAIRSLRADEAPDRVACVRRCYGDSYVDPEQYDADAIARAIRDGRRHSLVALTSDGAGVGHMGLTLRRIGDNTADAGMTLVLPEYRDGDVLRLQRLPVPPDARRAPVLESAAGRALCEFVLRDAAVVSGTTAAIGAD
jgi:hypothetical protein